MSRTKWERRESVQMRIIALDAEYAERLAGAQAALDALDAELENEPTEPRMDLSLVLAQATAADAVHENKAAE